MIDSHKLIYHPQRVAELADSIGNWEKYKVLKPIYAEISTSGACNHRCTFCSVDYIGYKTRFLSREVLLEFFAKASKIGLKSVMFAGDGEPLLQDICEIVEDANNYGIDTSFTTNGVHLSDKFINKSMKYVSWIKVSMNAGTSSAYKKIHRTSDKDFEKVWLNIDNAIKFRSKYSLDTAIGIQSLILPDNIDTLPALAERAKKSGVDYLVLKPYVHNVYMNQEGYEGIDYTSREYSTIIAKMKNDFDSQEFKIISRENALLKLIGQEERYDTCWSTPALWFYISGDGSVYSCGAHVGNQHFLLGNINSQSIEEIWHSDERKNCCDDVKNELDLNTCRRTCRMDEANKYLSNIIGDKIKHKNFI